MNFPSTLNNLPIPDVLYIILLVAILYSINNPNQKEPMSTPPANIYILDFDGTVTIKDTISAIAEAAISFQASKGRDSRLAWDQIVEAYGTDYAAFVESYRPVKEERRTLEEEVTFYRALKDVEMRSFRRVSEAGIFKGVGEGDWERFGVEAVVSGRVEVRGGFLEFVEGVTRRGARWGIVSVNFSRAFIRGVLSTVMRDGLEDVMVLSNQSGMDGILRGPERADVTGELMTTSDAKLSALKDMLDAMCCKSKDVGKVFYIGDSGTDIECLTEEGVVGIIISESTDSSLMNTIRRIGIEVTPINQNLGDVERGGTVWARDFRELM